MHTSFQKTVRNLPSLIDFHLHLIPTVFRLDQEAWNFQFYTKGTLRNIVLINFSLELGHPYVLLHQVHISLYYPV